ncbi:MAG: DNA-binding response regulator [Planctomycetes bacterium RBG_16_64_12]|nr:MAG: DNA-binding response regulator [Planctomycetes bacterium RBG_16_64_12]
MKSVSTHKHILVVEDEEHLAAGIKYNLDAEGYRVTTVGDGPSALRLIEENPEDVDLVILDLMLPGMSGYTVCEALRAGEKQMPILILSARTLAEDRTRGFDVGADQYLMKPFDLDEFLSRVKNLLTRYSRRFKDASKRSASIRSFEFGDATIDFETFQVTVRGEPVRMTPLEMKLLRYFVENEGRVIPRGELLENVWGMPGYLNTRAPDQFIRRLRKAFEPDPARPRHFLTIRDAGYRFVAAREES